MTKSQFKVSMDTAVFTTIYVVTDKKDITHVYHYEEDGAWQFFSDDPYDYYEEVASVVSLEEILKIDDSINDLADLKEGYYARRSSREEPWVINNIDQ